MVTLRVTCLVDDGHEGVIEKNAYELLGFGAALSLASEIEKGTKEMLECRITAGTK